MKAEDCPKLDECYKIKMILDKDLLDFQYAEAIRSVCANCSEVLDGGQDGTQGKGKGTAAEEGMGAGGFGAGNRR